MSISSLKGQVRLLLVSAAAAALLIPASSGASSARGAERGDSDQLQAISGEAVRNATATDPSGVRVPSGNVSGWNQVFSDNFSTGVPLGGFSDCTVAGTLADSNCAGLPSAVADKWFAYPDGWSDTALDGIYDPSQVLSIHNNELDFYLHSGTAGEPLVSAPLPKVPGAGPGGGLLYGAYMVRFRADVLPGYKTAWLLWPDAYDDGLAFWPSDGEIDFPEGDLNGEIGGFMHWQGARVGSEQDGLVTTDGYDRWQTALIEWTSQTVRFILNGQVLGTATQYIPDTPMHWVLQTETATDGTTPAPTTAGHVLVAWVAVYRPTT
jgi:hypothetical protein